MKEVVLQVVLLTYSAGAMSRPVSATYKSTQKKESSTGMWQCLKPEITNYITIVTGQHFFSLSFQAQNSPVPQILPTMDW